MAFLTCHKKVLAGMESAGYAVRDWRVRRVMDATYPGCIPACCPD